MKMSKTKKEELVNEVLERKYGDKLRKIDSDCFNAVMEEINSQIAGKPFKACEGYINYARYAYVYDSKVSYDERKKGEFSFNFPSKPCKNGSYYFHPKDDKQWRSFIDLKVKLKDKKEDDRSTLMAVMNSITTDKQLFETLPKLKPIYNSLFNERVSVSLVAIETVEKASSILDAL